jgi:hypothetical protein
MRALLVAAGLLCGFLIMVIAALFIDYPRAAVKVFVVDM